MNNEQGCNSHRALRRMQLRDHTEQTTAYLNYFPYQSTQFGFSMPTRVRRNRYCSV